MSAAFVGKICEHFENVTDPRVNRGTNFPLIEMVFVALCGAICDCNSWVDVASFGACKLAWFRKFLPFEKGVPSHDTFTELFARLDTLKFYAAQQRNAETAVTVGGFDEVICYGPRDIDRQFRVRNRSLLRSRIGAGYWLWKPYFIKRALDQLYYNLYWGSEFVIVGTPSAVNAQRCQPPAIARKLKAAPRLYTRIRLKNGATSCGTP